MSNTPPPDRHETVRPEGAKHEDPLTGEPGSHPIGTGLGAAAGAIAAGAAIGSVAGPLGTVAGTIVGGIAGAVAGKAIAESIDPTVESAYWQNEYRNRPYYDEKFDFRSYEPAYRAGWESYQEGSQWTTIEPKTRKSWEEGKWESEGGAPRLSWEAARQAAMDAYEKVHSQRRAADKSNPDQLMEP